MRTNFFMDKVVSLGELAEILNDEWYRGPEPIVCTTGAFDMLHPGHIKYLWQVSQHGQYLIVGIDSDHRVKQAKGDHRPFFSEDDRATVVAGLGFVDFVFIFHSMKELLDTVCPGVLVVSPTSKEDVEFDRIQYAKEKGAHIVEIAAQSSMHTSDHVLRILSKFGR